MRMRGLAPAGVPGLDVMVVLDSWDWIPAIDGVHRLVVPDGAEPSAFDWRCLVGLDVTLVSDLERSGFQRTACCLAALRAGRPATLALVFADLPLLG